MTTQSLVILIDSAVARRVRSFLGEQGHGYASLSEFAEVALLNQLETEQGARRESRAPADSSELSLSPASRGDLLAPIGDPPLELLEPAGVGDALFVLTNRLSPLKVAVRVLANLATTGRWPAARKFHDAAAAEARRLGMELRERDKREGRSGPSRLSTGYPVGKDAQAALDRFVFSFAASLRDGTCVGPLATLGLANCLDGRIGLTAAGWSLAAAPSPLLDGEGERTLSEEEAQILREQIRQAELEFAAVTEFISQVKRAAGKQGRVDELLSSAHSDWSADLTIAHRSAMLGRLSDAQALSVSGRGGAAIITLLPGAASFGDSALEQAS